MQETNILKRLTFAIDLLQEIKVVYGQLKQLSSDVEKYSGDLYGQLFVVGKAAVQDKIDQYNNNISLIKQINTDMTGRINSWYKFAKDPGEMKRILFPFRFHLKKKDLLSSIKKANQKIAEITIENRFIKEQLANWEHELELKAIQQIKQGDDYTSYEQLLSRKELLLAELKYLLPTLPKLCPIQLDFDNIDNIIDKLKEEAAV